MGSSLEIGLGQSEPVVTPRGRQRGYEWLCPGPEWGWALLKHSEGQESADMELGGTEAWQGEGQGR